MGKMTKMSKKMQTLKKAYNAELATCREADKIIRLKGCIGLLEHLLFEVSMLRKEKKNG